MIVSQEGQIIPQLSKPSIDSPYTYAQIVSKVMYQMIAHTDPQNVITQTYAPST